MEHASDTHTHTYTLSHMETNTHIVTVTATCRQEPKDQAALFQFIAAGRQAGRQEAAREANRLTVALSSLRAHIYR